MAHQERTGPLRRVYTRYGRSSDKLTNIRDRHEENFSGLIDFCGYMRIRTTKKQLDDFVAKGYAELRTRSNGSQAYIILDFLEGPLAGFKKCLP